MTTTTTTRNLRTWVKVTKSPSRRATTRVQINTSIEAARIIAMLFGKIGGDPNGPRGAVQAVYDALENARIAPYDVRDVFEQYVNPELDGPVRLAHMRAVWPIEKVRE